MTTRLRPPYEATDRGMIFQGKTVEDCPHCGAALSLMNYIGGLTLVCENVDCTYRSRSGAFFWQHPAT